MKITSSFLSLIVMLALAVPAFAQTFDTFGGTRAVIALPPKYHDAATPIITNGPIDLHGYYGVVAADIFSLTNGATGLTVGFYTSSDTTNLTALANYALATATSVVTTNANLGVGTNISATQTYLLPGSFTTPTAATAGFATPYLSPASYTNTAAVTVTGKNFYRIGWNAPDNARYLYIISTCTGGTTNAAVGVVLSGRRGYEVR